MELFERVKFLCREKKITQAHLASALGASPSKFCQWLTVKSQNNLWERLPKILEIFPDVRRDWLYFGEGEPFGNSPPQPTALTPPAPELDVQQLLARLEAVEKKLEIAGEEGDKAPYAGTQAGHAAHGVRQAGN